MQPITQTEVRPALTGARPYSWRAILSGLLALAVLLSSLHHLSCLGDDESFGSASAGLASPASASSVAVAIEKAAPPVSGDQCLSGHCHCVCHVSVQALADLVSSPVDFHGSAYAPRTDHWPGALAAFPPFKPPRA
jgi:hypothetical protein